MTRLIDLGENKERRLESTFRLLGENQDHIPQSKLPTVQYLFTFEISQEHGKFLDKFVVSSNIH